jgi:hypothetical protein
VVFAWRVTQSKKEGSEVKYAVIAAALAMSAGTALAQDARMSPEDIKSAWVGKKVQAQTIKGVQIEMRLATDGSATLGGGFTDSGKWRLTDTGYCATWQKIRGGKEACLTVVRRGEKTLVLNPDGSTNTEVLKVE